MCIVVVVVVVDDDDDDDDDDQHVIVNDIKIFSVAQQCFMINLCHR